MNNGFYYAIFLSVVFISCNSKEVEKKLKNDYFNVIQSNAIKGTGDSLVIGLISISRVFEPLIKND